MGYDFTTIVSREHTGSLKEYLTPPCVREAGYISFASGEMDFPTAPSLRESVKRMADNGLLGYTIRDEEYLSHVCWWMEHARSWKIDPNWIVTAYGTIFSVATCIRAFVGKEERIIVQPPFYLRYKQAADRLGRETVYNPLVVRDGRYVMDYEGLEKRMADPKNRLLVLCNPHNPSGRVFTREELEPVARLSERYGTIVFSDEIFAEIVFDGAVVTPYASLPAGQKNAITCTSLGKSFNCTGLNHANVIIPDETLRERFETQRTQDHYGSIDPASYAATLGAYSPEGLDWLCAMRGAVKQNVDYVHTFFQEHLPQFPVMPTEGAFVCWIDFSVLGLENEELENYLAEKALFHVDPGYHYGDGFSGHARMNLSSTMEQTHLAMERLSAAFGDGPIG